MIKRIGLFGGTFNPVHCGHLELAEYACEEMHLEHVIFIPSFSPPHKSDDYIESFKHRVAMLRVALQGYQSFSVSEIEGELTTPSYSIDMLRRLIESTEGEVDYYFIIGVDAFLEIHLWNKYEDVLAMVHFIVAARHGIEKNTIHQFFKSLGYEKNDEYWYSSRYNKKIHHLDEMVLQVSSTELRGRVTQSNCRTALPSGVRRYIDLHGLYVSESL